MMPSDQATEPRGVRPGPKTPASERILGRPDLLERRPVIRRALVEVEPRAVGALEAEVHLQAAVVRGTRIGPAPLVAVDAEPLPQMRRMLGPETRRVRAPEPEPDRLPKIG